MNLNSNDIFGCESKKKICILQKMVERPKCQQRDEMVYYTFWPVIAFSFFIASDKILDEREYGEFTNSGIQAMVYISESFIHVFSLSTLILALLEGYIAYAYIDNSLCTRTPFLEFDAFISAFFLFVLTFIDTLNLGMPSSDPMSDLTKMLCKLIPWVIATSVFVFQFTYILRKLGVCNRCMLMVQGCLIE